MSDTEDPNAVLADESFRQFVQDYEVAVGVIAQAAKEFAPEHGLIASMSRDSEDPYDHFGRAVLARLMNADPRLTIARLDDE